MGQAKKTDRTVAGLFITGVNKEKNNNANPCAITAGLGMGKRPILPASRPNVIF